MKKLIKDISDEEIKNKLQEIADNTRKLHEFIKTQMKNTTKDKIIHEN